jgi:hypothetical protein
MAKINLFLSMQNQRLKLLVKKYQKARPNWLFFITSY